MSTIKILGVWLTLSFWGAVVHAGTVTYVYTDPQGTPLAEADATGTITARFDYAPYGTAVASMSPAPNGPGYTGHVNDPESGLVYMQARYYDSAVGRFLSVDPVMSIAGQLAKINKYGYVSANPINMVDPDGKDSLWVQSGAHTTIVIPVHFVGPGAENKRNIDTIISMAKHLEIVNHNVSISIVSSDKAISGHLNTMDLSPGTDYDNFPNDAGEGVNDLGGNKGHINTNNSDWMRAALHDILHFAAFKDGYKASGKGDRRKLTGYLSGYSMDNIMANRRGDEVDQKEIDDANDYGRRRGSNLVCRQVGPEHIIVCS